MRSSPPKSFVFFIFLFFLNLTAVFGQISIHGRILNSEGKAVSYATVQLLKSDSVSIVNYSVSDEMGEFKVTADKSDRYVIKLRHLTHLPEIQLMDLDTADSPYQRTFILTEQSSELDSVIVHAPKAAMKINGDTISYTMDLFLTGRESKLKDILMKLPGIELTPDGKILANGKLISDLLVDGETVFGNNHKILLETLNAEIVDGVQLFTNYERNRILRGLEQKDEQALNIQVKEEFKGKISGDLEATLATGRRSGARANGYRFGIKNNLSIISDANLLNRQILSSKEYNELKNDFTDDEFSSFGNRQNESQEASSFLQENEKIRNRKISLVGVSYGQKLGEKISLNVFSLWSKQKQTSELNSDREFLTLSEEDKITEEKKEVDGNSISQTFLTAAYHTNKIEIKYNFLLDLGAESGNDSIVTSLSASQGQALSQNRDLRVAGVLNRISLTKRINDGSVLHAKAYFKTTARTNGLEINADTLLFNNTLSTVNQNLTNASNDLGGGLHYRIYKPRSVIGLYAGIDRQFRKLSEKENAIGIPIELISNNSYFGSSIKAKLGQLNASYDFTLNRINIQDKSETQINQFVFLPAAKLEYSISELHTIELEYRRLLDFPSIEKLVRGELFIDYRTLAIGSSIRAGDLSISDQFNINHQYIDLYHGLTIFNFFRYTHQDAVFTSDNNFVNDHNRLTHRLGENNKKLISGSMVELRFSDFPLVVKTTNTFAKFTNSSFTQGIENGLEVVTVDSKTEMKPRLSSRLPVPTAGIWFNYTNASFEISSNHNMLRRIEPFLGVLYSFQWGIQFEFSFAREIYIEEQMSNRLSKLNMTIDYKKENSDWKFSLIGQDILNLKRSELIEISNYPNQLIRNRVSRFPGYIALSISKII